MGTKVTCWPMRLVFCGAVAAVTSCVALGMGTGKSGRSGEYGAGARGRRAKKAQATNKASDENARSESNREVVAGDYDWKFMLGDVAGAEAAGFDDANWRTVTLPHDWSIEGKVDRNNPAGSGGGYFPGGVGWYRKTFAAPASWKGKRVSVEFDGVYMNATVYLNGQKLGTHPYGYTSFSYELTPKLNFGGANVLAVRVDNSEQPNSRWYSGSGIYRHVRLVATDPVHVAQWGVYVATPEVSANEAKVNVRTRVANASNEAVDIFLQTDLIAPSGAAAGLNRSRVKAAAGDSFEVTQEITVSQPARWSPETPKMYRAVTKIIRGGTTIDEVTTPFGIRSIAWSAEKGFLLNGKAILLHGGSVHADNGPLGAAAFDRAEERRVELLKAAGMNAVRTAHNPPSPAFLDACDRLGLLVLDEPFDVWTKSKAKYDYARFFNEWWERDIDSMVLRDRNHPSVVVWGIGNEIPEAWTKEGAPLAQKLAARVRALDDTRPLTQAFPGATYTANTDAVFAVLDIGGYNYNLVTNQAGDHKRLPKRIMMTTESLPATAFEQWKTVTENPYIVGEFVWTAMDYLGESGIGSWRYATPEQAAIADEIQKTMKAKMGSMGADGENPFEAFNKNQTQAAQYYSFLFPGYPWHAADCGDMDLTGYRKPISYYREMLWNAGDQVFATVRAPEPEGKKIVAIGWSVYPTVQSWTWPGREGKEMDVEVYSRAERVRLLLNDNVVGELPTGKAQEFKAVFHVRYAPGKLRAVGLRGGREVAERDLETVGPAERLQLTPDRNFLTADGEDLSFVTVEALDAEGRLQVNTDREVRFSISGPGTIAAVGNADGQSMESYQGDRRALVGGRALVIVRTSRTPGLIRLSAKMEGLVSNEVVLRTRERKPAQGRE